MLRRFEELLRRPDICLNEKPDPLRPVTGLTGGLPVEIVVARGVVGDVDDAVSLTDVVSSTEDWVVGNGWGSEGELVEGADASGIVNVEGD